MHFSASDSESDFEADVISAAPMCPNKSMPLPIVSSTARKSQGGFDINPLSVLQTQCCSDTCLLKLCVYDVLECRRQMQRLNESQQKQFIVDTLASHSSVRNTGRKLIVEINLVINSKGVCGKAWCAMYNVSQWRYRQCIEAIKKGKTRIVHGNKVANSHAEDKTSSALAWMTCLFERMGDYMPHKDVIHLPHTWKKDFFIIECAGKWYIEA